MRLTHQPPKPSAQVLPNRTWDFLQDVLLCPHPHPGGTRCSRTPPAAAALRPALRLWSLRPQSTAATGCLFEVQLEDDSLGLRKLPWPPVFCSVKSKLNSCNFSRKAGAPSEATLRLTSLLLPSEWVPLSLRTGCCSPGPQGLCSYCSSHQEAIPLSPDSPLQTCLTTTSQRCPKSPVFHHSLVHQPVLNRL